MLSRISTQDAALSSVGDILDRMSSIKTLYGDDGSGLNTTDKANYASEFRELQAQLNAFKGEDSTPLACSQLRYIQGCVYLYAG